MKFSFAFLAVLFVARTLEISAVPIHNEQHKTLASAGLPADLQDFLSLVPVDKIQEIFYQYLADDEDFGAALDYVLSEEFQTLITEIEAEAEVRELLNYLEDAGLAAYDFINKINDLLGIERITPKATFGTITGGLPGFIKDIKAVLPIDKIEKLYKEKLETSEDFAKLVKRLSSQEFQGLIDKIMANPKLQNLMKRAEAKGVDVQAILDFFTSILGLKFPSRPVFSLTRDLKDDLNDFLALVPVEKIKDIFFEYLAEDEDFAEALEYLLSDEFKSLVVEVESQPEVLSILKYLQESGLDAFEFVNKINGLLGIDRITTRRYTKAIRIIGGLTGFFKDIETVLPLKEIEELYQEKMASSKQFYALIKQLSSPQFQKLVDQIMVNPKLQNLIRRAEAKGVNVQSVFDFLTNLLGLQFPSQQVYSLKRNLKDDLNDFLALIPVQKIQEIFYEYLANDEAFGEALDYVLSEEFQGLVIEIEAQKEVKQLLNFLQDSGLQAYEFINKINDLLGIDHIVPRINYRSNRITGGLPGFIQDIKAALPIDKIEELYEEKLKTSTDFAALIKRLSSDEFQGLVDRLLDNAELQNLIKRAEAKGVDVQAIFDFISSVLGLKFPTRPTVFFLTRNLKDDLNDFLALIPVQKIQEIFYEYLANDEAFGEALDYVLSEEFQGLVIEIEAQKEVKQLLNFLQDSGLQAYEFINKINDLLGIDHIVPRINYRSNRITGGLPGFIQDIKAALPIDKIEELYEEKLKTSTDFAALIKRLSSDEFQGLVDRLLDNAELQNLIKRAEAKGVDVQAIFDFLSSVLGLKFPTRPSVFFLTRNLKDDLNDFLALIPVEKIQEIFYEYLANDEAFGEALDYVLSEEFQGLVIEIEAQKEVKQLLNFLQDSGLQAYEFINKINDLLGIDHIVPRINYRSNRITGGLPGFIQDIKAALPIDKIEELYEEKLKTSTDFAALIKRLSSDEFQGLVDRLLDNAELQNLIKRAEAKGVDVQAIFDFLSSVLGLKFPTRPTVFFLTRNLKDDLNDFLALIPVQKIQEIFYEYLANDEAFGEALDYVLSEEFQDLVIEIEAQKEVKQLLNFLQDSGLQAYEFINKINDLLGIDHIVPRINYRSNRITGGLPGFIQDIKAALPIDKIEELYEEKLKTSTDFAALIKRLSSDEFQGLVDRLLDNAELQNLIKRAEAKGVDVQAIFDFLSSVLGLKFPTRPTVFFLTRNLKDDLNDFLALIPVQKIQEIFYEYLANDEAFGEALDYVLSEEFQGLVIEIEAQKEVKQLLNFLQDSGLQAYEFINKINDLLGIDHIVPRINYRSNRITGGLPGFIQDIKAALPIDKIEELYEEKLKTSTDFAALIKRLSSDEFQGLVDRLLDNAELQNLIKRAEAKGVDVQAIFDFLSSVLGLKFPTRPTVFFLTRNLKDDLNDFLALIPVEKIQEIFYEYLANDEAFGEALDYVLSEEFQGLVIEIEAQKEVKQLLNFLQDSGLQAYEFINKINDLLGIDHIIPRTNYRSNRITGGLPGFIQDIKAALPIDKIEELYEEKLKTSTDFAALIKRLSSDEFQGLVDRLLDNAELQNLIKRAEAKGVDVQAIFDFISSVLGLKFPTRPVFFKEEEAIDVLRQIWAKVPLDNILDIIVDYLIGDEDFKKVVKFMMGDEFKMILVEIEDLSEVKALLKFLHETGLDVYKWMNDFHDLIGLDVELPLSNNYQEITGGVPGLIKDIRALLPIEELYKFYDEKLETCAKFREFIHRLETKELQNAVDALGKHDGFNLMLNKLEALGVDWDAVTEIISAIIGIKFPERPH